MNPHLHLGATHHRRTIGVGRHSVDVKNGFGTALSATVEMLTFVGSADGTCFGQKNGPQDSLSVYVKEGNAWKLAFSFGTAGM